MSNNPEQVNHPDHYNQDDKIECIEALKAQSSHEEFIGFLKCSVAKYVWRYRHKENPLRDLKKTRVYLDRLIKETEEAGPVIIDPEFINRVFSDIDAADAKKCESQDETSPPLAGPKNTKRFGGKP